jgi:hypothetical protein
LAAGATVRCVFTDTKLSSITVVKTTTGGDGSFAFTGSLGSFNLATVNGTAQRVFANVLAGSYRISETVPPGWRLTNAGCADGSNPASISLGAGKDVTCTFANTKGGSLAVVVNATDGNGSFAFTSTALGDFSVATSGGTGQKGFANLAPGVYDLNEVITAGWDQGAASCSNGSNPATVSVAAGVGDLHLRQQLHADVALHAAHCQTVGNTGSGPAHPRTAGQGVSAMKAYIMLLASVVALFWAAGIAATPPVLAQTSARLHAMNLRALPQQPAGSDLPPADIANDEGGPEVVTGEWAYSSALVLTHYEDPSVVLANITPYVLGDWTAWVPEDGQILGRLTSPAAPSPATFEVRVPIRMDGAAADVDNDGETDPGVQIYA